jgi:hypothetical protein
MELDLDAAEVKAILLNAVNSNMTLSPPFNHVALLFTGGQFVCAEITTKPEEDK